ncbi:MAG: arginyltransferase [Magnetovibrionaceae bacterium]
MNKPFIGTRYFFATAPLPCPYLAGKVERRVVTELAGRDASDLHDSLSLAGFRRSHGIAYSPACPDCNACVAVRILAKDFKPSKTQRRIWKRNADVQVESVDRVTNEQYRLFATYQQGRHADGDMTKMDFLDYQRLVEETPVETTLLEFRDPDGSLIGACLTDFLGDGLSAVYSFYDNTDPKRSLGSYMIMWLVDRTVHLGLDHTYLGFWVEGCGKMAYKVRFQPLEGYTPSGWKQLTAEDRLATWAEPNHTPF